MPQKAEHTYTPLHVATLIGMAAVALMITAGAAYWMWDAARIPRTVNSTPLTDAQRADLAVRGAQLRVDVIRNVLAVGAGSGGLLALTLALRRQYVKERVDRSDLVHKEKTAKSTEHDATERRITDLYAKAAEQLGSDKAPVRMAALYALERLAQDNIAHRQTIVNVICAYLRMPFSLPDLDPWGSNITENEKIQELEVRLAAQQVLTKHSWCVIHEGKALEVYPETYWEDLELKLDGATLVDFDISNCSISDLTLDRATLYGSFEASQSLIGSLAAEGAHFNCDAKFSETVFSRLASFTQATFGREVSFRGTSFESIGGFIETNFSGAADFSDTHGIVILARATAILKPPKSRHIWPPGHVLQASSKQGLGTLVEQPNSAAPA